MHLLQFSADFVVFLFFKVFKEQLKDAQFASAAHVRAGFEVGLVERYPLIEHLPRHTVVCSINLAEEDFEGGTVVEGCVHIGLFA